MDDYYSIIGVEADASVDDIRSAYRERKEALSGANGGSKTEAAQLNKAWNVLSDPYQRDRYDAQRAQAVDDDDVDVDDDASVEPSTNGSKRASGRDGRKTPPPRRGREPGPPTITPPAGTQYAATKQRIIAMVIDLLVLLVLFIGLQLGAAQLARSQKPDVVDKVDQLGKQITNLQKQRDAAQSQLNDAKKNNPSAVSADQKKVDDLNTQIKNTTTERDAEARKLNPYYLWASVLACGIGLLYLAIPTALTGRTLGKWRQHLKVVRDNGDPVGWSGAFLRWGPVVGVTFGLMYLLQGSPLGAVIVLFGVTLWIRNVNHQGVHDRLAHTIVVSDAAN